MSGEQIQILAAMCVYLVSLVVIGIYYMKTASESSEQYFLGGRKLGPWVAAMSAEASDMSGWLLMGLPGVAYWFGLSDAIWTAIGLAAGTYINWLVVAKRLRRYSALAGNSITIPEFLSNRFREKKRIILTIGALFILVFFAVYAASCFVTFGKLFSTLFGMKYQIVMIIGAVIVILYTYLGGFLAESATDFLQGIVMIIALCAVLIIGVIAGGGIQAILGNIKSIPGFFDFFGIAQPQLTADGVQQLDAAGKPLFGPAGGYGLLTIISTMSWGLGYFGMPQVLLRFMAINKSVELKIKAHSDNMVRNFTVCSGCDRTDRKIAVSRRTADTEPVRKHIHHHVHRTATRISVRHHHVRHTCCDDEFVGFIPAHRFVGTVA